MSTIMQLVHANECIVNVKGQVLELPTLVGMLLKFSELFFSA